MNEPAKYLFDSDFAPAAKAATTIALTEHKTIVAEAETRGYRNGFQAAEAEMKAETARRLAIALEQVGLMMELMAQGLKEIDMRLETEAVEVAHAVATKLAPALIAREPLAEIEALATACFRQLLKSPHVVVRVSDKLYDAARAKLEEIAQQTGFEGRLVMLAEPEIAEGDCRIEWADGGVTRDRAAAEALIAETVNRFVTARHHTAD
ncbi:MAG: flagellar assembly protein FliH [Pseudorhodoplanes sp.]|nr:flagellar assembly protein FliH [Pseudorhodoplanes sp.]